MIKRLVSKLIVFGIPAFIVGFVLSHYDVITFTDERNARIALEATGFNDIEMTGYDFFACAKDDLFHTGFKARNIRGETVTGVVCSGFFKGSTVRF